MTAYKVVVDGSNVATEGRTRPSLSQLDEAVRSFLEEYPNADVIVIVDSSFPNRIDPADVAVFEEAFLAGEIITPPAGTVGRGDAFILKVADKLGATVFSNDSFQEFHGTYDWLFEKGRLVGGKPIPGLGWVFTPRVPVRGQKSREAVREAKRQTVRVGSPEAMRPMPVPKAPPPFLTKGRADEADGFDGAPDDGRRRRKKRRGSRDDRDGRNGGGQRDQRGDVVVSFDEDSIGQAAAGREDSGRSGGLGDTDGGNNRRKRRQRGRAEGGVEVAPRAVNEPGTFLTFIASHLPGSAVDGVVEDYASHGFYVTAGGARCYVPLSGLAEPMPRSAKEVVRRGETQHFIVKAFDAVRRGIELALVGTPGAGAVAPTTVAVDLPKKGKAAKAPKPDKAPKTPRTSTAKAPKGAVAAVGSARPPASAALTSSTGRSVTKKAATTKAPAAPASVKRAAVTKGAVATAAKKASAKKVAAKKVASRKAPTAPDPALKAPAKKASAVTTATKAPAKKAAVKKSSAKSAPIKAPAPAKKVPAKKVPAKQAEARKAPAKKALAKKAPAQKAPAQKAPATRMPAKKAVAKK